MIFDGPETLLFKWTLIVLRLSFCEKKSKKSFCLHLWNHLLIVKILPVTLFRELVPAYWQPPVTLKDVSIAAALILKIAWSESRLWMYTEENRPMRAKETWSINCMHLSEQLFRVSKWIQRRQINFIFVFPLNKTGKNFKYHMRRYRNYWSNCIFIRWPDLFKVTAWAMRFCDKNG